MSTNHSFQQLLKPGRIGTLELKNRIVMAPMGNGYGTVDGYVTDRLKAWFEERAKGGVGLIIVGVVPVDYPRGCTEPGQIGISDDRFIPGLIELANSVHRFGAKIALQLLHGGRISSTSIHPENVPLGPSPIPLYDGAEAPRELTVEDINHLVLLFADAAERAQKASFDGVEIHAGHGYLLDSFLSRHDNKRQDEYGGSLENRSQFLLEVIDGIRNRVGRDYPLWPRINGRTFGIEDGTTLEEALQVSKWLEQSGVDAIHVSGYGGSLGVGFTEAPLVHRPGNLLPTAQTIKREVNVPIIAVGRISPELGEQTLCEGNADFIAMGRQLLADPHLPNKLADGKRKNIRPCISCYTCVDQNFYQQPIICAVNAAVGREASYNLQPANNPKRVTIIGGGPAGMEAARVAALRAHEVALYEKENRLGGSLFFAAIARKENGDLIVYLERELHRLDVKVHLGVEVTPDSIQKEKPDVVIVATGADYPELAIPGIARKNVLGSEEFRGLINGRFGPGIRKKLTFSQRLMLTIGTPVLRNFLTPAIARRLTQWWMPVGKQVVIIGGDLVGCELAEFLAERGRKVSIVEKSKRLAPEMAIPLWWILKDQLKQRGVTMLRRVVCEEINNRGVIISDANGAKQTIVADTIILAPGVKSNLELFDAAKAKGIDARLAGDCAELRLIKGSIADGADVALSI